MSIVPSPFIDADTLVIAVSQSGETMDTLESVKLAREAGAQTLAVCNVPHSSIVRACPGAVMLEVGPEIEFASTKAFTGMILHLVMTVARMAAVHDRLSAAERESIDEALRMLPLK